MITHFLEKPFYDVLLKRNSIKEWFPHGIEEWFRTNGKLWMIKIFNG